uniref:C-type lectin domain-containing protein n=1 Tax=Cyprinus carpio TaxID=7962 RepID=A0A8C1JR85_CYPCA
GDRIVCVSLVLIIIIIIFLAAVYLNAVLSTGLFLKTSCYFVLIQEPKTWTEAQSYCKQYHWDLATIQSDEDRYKIQEVAAAAKFQNRAWMGLYDGLFVWRWSYQDQNLDYSNWASLEETTSRTQRMCGLIRNTGKWHVASCEEQKPFFCYKGKIFMGLC